MVDIDTAYSMMRINDEEFVDEITCERRYFFMGSIEIALFDFVEDKEFL